MPGEPITPAAHFFGAPRRAAPPLLARRHGDALAPVSPGQGSQLIDLEVHLEQIFDTISYDSPVGCARVHLDALAMGDVLVGHPGDMHLARVLHAVPDSEGRLWCGALDGSRLEGWVRIGDDGAAWRLPASAAGSSGEGGPTTAEGRRELCRGGESPIRYSLSTEATEMARPYPGTADGCGICPAPSTDTPAPFHAPTARCAADIHTNAALVQAFRAAMDTLARTPEERVLEWARVLLAATDHVRALPEVPEGLRAVVRAVAAPAPPVVRQALAVRAAMLWADPSAPAVISSPAVGCLPEHAERPIISAALAVARKAGIPLAVLPGEVLPAQVVYGPQGPQGAFFSPAGTGVEAEMFVDGRHTERCLTSSQVARTRPLRNGALTEVRDAFGRAGWAAFDRNSTNTRTTRLTSVVAQPPQAAGAASSPHWA